MREMADLLVPDGYLLISLLTDIDYGGQSAPPDRLMLTEEQGRELLVNALGHLDLQGISRNFFFTEDNFIFDLARRELISSFYQSVHLTAVFRNTMR